MFSAFVGDVRKMLFQLNEISQTDEFHSILNKRLLVCFRRIAAQIMPPGNKKLLLNRNSKRKINIYNK